MISTLMTSSARVLAALRKQSRPAIVVFTLLMLLTGFAYPILVTGFAQTLFPHQANGSVIEQNGTVVGSELIGQPFSDPDYFWGRLSATPGFEYNASMSSGSNLGPSNPALTAMVEERIAALHAVDPNNTFPIPSDLVTSSGSGLDPHISVAAAYYQLPRVARERNLSQEEVATLIEDNTDDRVLGVLGEKVVNVLELNLALDAHQSSGDPNDEEVTKSAGVDTRFLGLTTLEWIFLIIVFVLLALIIVPMGTFIFKIFSGERTIISNWVDRGHNFISRHAKGLENDEMDWKGYAFSLVLFNFIGICFLFVVLVTQNYLPLNPQDLPGVPVDLAFNAAVSFGTNTNWQSYGGETTMSYFSQMVGLTVQNFLSAATGLAVLFALIRGFSRQSTRKLGNFWFDIIKATLILLPLSFIIALLLVSQGCVQTFDGPLTVQLLQPVIDDGGNLITEQLIPLGPVASQEAIKLLGTNGGGFFNVNSAHPFENPNSISNLIEILAMLIIPMGLCITFGLMVKDRRQGVAILIAMLILFVAFLGIAIWAEEGGNPALTSLGIDQTATDIHPGGNLEGKEMRFGTVPSTFFVVSTTATACGAVNSMIDSYTPLGGMVPLFLMQFGEVVFGGVGSGLYGMLVFVILANFIAGLMIGRMPEYLGKKIGPHEMKLCVAIIIIPLMAILLGTAMAVLLPEGRAGILNPGPHGFSEVLYAFTSAAQNNGSAMAGLASNNLFYNIALGIAMLIGRFPVAILTLALAQSMAMKRTVPVSSGTLPTHTPLFITWLVGVVFLLGALSYLACLALGPIAEHLFLP
jgi:potassium-transporting ATPase potassium-binding subunit